jgi:hypothetical protein
MAGPSVTTQRIDWAARRLMECRSTSAVVAELAEREGLSRRQARRLVGKAHAVLVDDLEQAGVDRQQLTAQLAHALVESVHKSLQAGHTAALVGACRELRELLHLTRKM